MSNPQKKWRLAVMVSGSGSNLQSLIDGCKAGDINAEIVVVSSNKKSAYGLARAREAGIETLVFSPEKFSTRTEMCAKSAKAFKERQVDMVCLAGYLLKLEPCLIRSFPNRIINIHPALLPKYGGKGMYGHYVHDAVIKNKEKESGATIHLVDEILDHGSIIEQVKVPVLETDTGQSLAERILPEEHKLYGGVVKKICDGTINLDKLQRGDS